MLTLDIANGILQLARRFYKADGALKSNNKWYGFNTGEEGKAADKLAAAKRNMTREEARERVNRRSAAVLAKRPERLSKDAMKQLTPVEYGGLLVNSHQTSGNCGEMAAVAMYFASAGPCEPKHMSMVTAYNKFSMRGLFDQMTFGHSWALLGEEGKPQFVVDPWSGIACANSDFQREFTAKMNKWQQQGKRICVTYKSGNDWYCANDSNVLSLFGPLATTYFDKGDVKFAS